MTSYMTFAKLTLAAKKLHLGSESTGTKVTEVLPGTSSDTSRGSQRFQLHKLAPLGDDLLHPWP